LHIKKASKCANARRDPQGMARPFQGLQRGSSAFNGFPQGEASEAIYGVAPS